MLFFISITLIACSVFGLLCYGLEALLYKINNAQNKKRGIIDKAK